jgi:membrane protein DedA with SNARE-associated domain
VLGGIAGYGIGYFGGRPLLYRFFDPGKIKAVESYYDRFNAWATAIGALTPLPYKIFTVAGGAFAVRFWVFVLASILARSLRFFAVAGLIWYFGESITTLIERYINLISIVIVVCLIGGYWLLARTVRRAGETAEGASAAPISDTPAQESPPEPAPTDGSSSQS